MYIYLSLDLYIILYSVDVYIILKPHQNSYSMFIATTFNPLDLQNYVFNA